MSNQLKIIIGIVIGLATLAGGAIAVNEYVAKNEDIELLTMNVQETFDKINVRIDKNELQDYIRHLKRRCDEMRRSYGQRAESMPEYQNLQYDLQTAEQELMILKRRK